MSKVFYLGSTDDAERLELRRLDSEEGAQSTSFRVERGDGVVDSIDVVDSGSGQVHLMVGSRSYRCDVFRDGDRTWVALKGKVFQIPLLDERRYRRLQRSGEGSEEGGPELISPMSGKVVALNAAVGDRVRVGQGLVILEAMKMENEIKSSRDGVVEAVCVEVGQSVEPGAVLLRVASSEESEETSDE